MSNSSFLIDDSLDENQEAVNFCQLFVQPNSYPKYLFGRNIYADKIVASVEIDGFIDDYATNEFYLGKPLVPLDAVPANALVLILSGGNTLTAIQKVKQRGLSYLDYFMFSKFADISLTPILFWDNPRADFDENVTRYEHIYSRLADIESKQAFKQLINFKYSHDIRYMSGFKNREAEQYFEPFLNLAADNECFVDVGAFDGYTSGCFTRICPDYHGIHLFEPDPDNLLLAKQRLKDFPNVSFYPYGLSNRSQKLYFSPQGSGSHIADHGQTLIEVDKLDTMLKDENSVTFIKMDIEGAEIEALKGARNIIQNHHPRLAISVYHHACDFWKVPELVLSIRDDYEIYFRHYTESLYESVMFFMPRPKYS